MAPRALASIAFALALASPAAASTTVNNYSSSGQIVVFGDGADNQIRIDLVENGSKWRIRDQARTVETSPSNDPSCVQGADFHTLLCDRAASKSAVVQSASGGSGDDKIKLGRGVRTIDMSGDDGNDILTGAGRDDRLNGGPGNDVLTGGEGVDRLYGAGGNDVLKARDGTKDGLIQCDGPGGGSAGGGDRAVIDGKDKPFGTCEKIALPG